MLYYVILILILSAVCVTQYSCEEANGMTCSVKVAQGSLRGKECISYSGRKYYSFEGIPYAKPPVGNLRFQDPQPPENWSGIRDALKPGQKCVQLNLDDNINGSEDCLYLNVYTPVLPDEEIKKLPVLFFVHGGKLRFGCADLYRPDYFMQNDVVLVTINYRLHVLGFLCLHIPEAPGNAGCKDTIMALKWVKDNIKQFGGDENNVTAFGESSGAAIVTSYLTSKMADGLVHKIIAESTVSFSESFVSEETTIATAKSVSSYLGYESDDAKSIYDFLVKVPLKDLIRAVQELVKLAKFDPQQAFKPYFPVIVERKHEGMEQFFEELPWVSMKANRYKKLPILLGISSHEGALFLERDSKGNIIYNNEMQEFVPYLNLPFNSPKSQNVARLIRESYFQNKEVNDSLLEQYIHLLSDTIFNRETILFAEMFSKYSNSLYFYHFCYYGNLHLRVLKELGVKGATHSDITQYQFYKKSKADKSDDKDKKMVKFFNETWCNFALNGKPTWKDQQFQWPVYRPGERLCLNIGEELSVVKCPVWARLQIWLNNIGGRAKL